MRTTKRAIYRSRAVRVGYARRLAQRIMNPELTKIMLGAFVQHEMSAEAQAERFNRDIESAMTPEQLDVRRKAIEAEQSLIVARRECQHPQELCSKMTADDYETKGPACGRSWTTFKCHVCGHVWREYE